MKSRAKSAGAAPVGAKEAGAQPGTLPGAPLWIPALLTLIFAAFLLLPRVNENPRLSASFLAATGLLVAVLAWLWWSVRQSGRALTYEFVPRPVHWVQLMMHSSVYAYWGWYWREVYHEIPLILSQIVFLYVLDMLVSWSRRGKWILGFGPIPIILSTNLFQWFRDDWYYLQFLTVVLIVFGKEFLRWKRDGQDTHIFNPSAFALFVTSAVLIATNSTRITWGNEIATTFLNPPNFFVEIFVLGLIVQSLFQVTLVTLSAAASLFVLNLIYTGATGTYMFIDTNIHPAIFLGLHLLVTDPATSPRKNFGKAIFGAAYGACTFALVPVLEGLGAPVFYDKLLCVPVLNLTVRILDRMSAGASAWFARQQWAELGPLHALSAWTPRQANFGFMGLWVAFFGFLFTTGFLAIGEQHPGANPALWEKACAAGSARSCDALARILDVQCQRNSAGGCLALGELMNGGKGLPRNAAGAARTFKQACELGLESGCAALVGMVKTDGEGVLLQPCRAGDGRSCFMLGSLYYGGEGVTRSLEYSATLFQQSCAAGFARGCGQLGQSFLFGEGVPRDFAKARPLLERGCDAGYGEGCYNAGLMYRQGIAAPKDEAVALARFKQGCEFGDPKACAALGQAVVK